MLIAARTETGLVRDQNQDRYLAWDLAVDAGARAGRYTFCAVADGMGGSAAGDRASSLGLAAFSAQLFNLLTSRCGEEILSPCDIPRGFADCVRISNDRVFKAAEFDESLKGMGATLTAGLIARGVLYLAQVGDSRCYRLRGESLTQLTEDHSLVAELVRMGKLSPDAVRTHPRRNVITRAIGVGNDIEPEISSHVILEGDTYLFCSDGLWELVTEEEMVAILLQRLRPDPAPTIQTAGGLQERESGHERPGVSGIPDPTGASDQSEVPGQRGPLDEVCEELVRQALARGGHDNITVLLARARPEDVHPDAERDLVAFARTRIESAPGGDADLKRTLRYRLQEWQQ